MFPESSGPMEIVALMWGADTAVQLGERFDPRLLWPAALQLDHPADRAGVDSGRQDV